MDMQPLILIVDDRPEDIELTETALSMLGCGARTRSASTGEEAMGFLHATEQLPDMILLDLKMPGMGGLETLRKIRADERLKSIPVIIVTSSTLADDENNGRDAGSSGFIHKSISLAEFTTDLGQQVQCWL